MMLHASWGALERNPGLIPSGFYCSLVGVFSLSFSFTEENKEAKTVRPPVVTRENLSFVLESLLQDLICHLQGNWDT